MWKGIQFDIPGYFGRNLKVVENIARDFDTNIVDHYNFRVVVQFESGETKRFEIQGVQLTHVS